MFSPRRALSIILLLTAASVIIACGDSETCTTTDRADATAPVATGEQDQVLALDDSYDNSTMELTVGVEIVLRLEGNPTTGYAWVVKSDGAPVLEQQGEPDYMAESDLEGAPGTYTWRFDVVEAGTAGLELIYHQPWDEQAPPDKSFSITVEAVAGPERG
jgi:inhibitor of cysteine peptidase